MKGQKLVTTLKKRRVYVSFVRLLEDLDQHKDQRDQRGSKHAEHGGAVAELGFAKGFWLVFDAVKQKKQQSCYQHCNQHGIRCFSLL